MPYNTYSEVIRVCGLDPDISDTTLTRFINEADKMIIDRITVKVIDEKLTGTINGSNKEYWTKYKNLADINANMLIQGYESGKVSKDDADYHVYTWTDEEDEDTKVEVEVDNTKCNPYTGRIYLKTAPSNVEVVTIDYSYYPNKVDMDILKNCAALYAGYLYLRSEYSLFPVKLKLGPLTVDFSERGLGRGAGSSGGLPYSRILREFNRQWMLIFKKPFRKVVGKPKEEPVARRVGELIVLEEEEDN